MTANSGTKCCAICQKNNFTTLKMFHGLVLQVQPKLSSCLGLWRVAKFSGVDGIAVLRRVMVYRFCRLAQDIVQ